MPILHLLLVALIQGVTEFLPISSSGHLILLPALTGVEDQGLAIDVAVHVGSLIAVMLYYRHDMTRMLLGLGDLLRGRVESDGARLVLLLAIATLPVIVAGAALSLFGLDAHLRSVLVIGVATLIFGILLWIADRLGAQARDIHDWSPKKALILGLWQALALIPGTSRSGITITGARFLGFQRHEAVRVAMLMSIPTILASAALLAPEVAVSNAGLLRDAAIAAVFACFAALAALHLMVRLLNAVSFTPYVIYRICLGTVLIVYALSN